MFCSLVLLRVLVRKRWLAAVLFVAIFTIPKVLGSDHMVVDTHSGRALRADRARNQQPDVQRVAESAVLAGFFHLLAATCVFIALIFVAIGAWGIYTSLAGRPLWKDELFE